MSQENNNVEVVEEVFEKQEVQEVHEKASPITEFDAIHPRFQTQNPEEVRQFQIKNDYYCEYCEQFFAPTVAALKTHFRGDMVQHRPCGTCYYCRGDVFEYKLDNKRQLYHNCREHHKDE